MESDSFVARFGPMKTVRYLLGLCFALHVTS